jgi:hypothetical protein
MPEKLAARNERLGARQMIFPVALLFAIPGLRFMMAKNAARECGTVSLR